MHQGFSYGERKRISREERSDINPLSNPTSVEVKYEEKKERA